MPGLRPFLGDFEVIDRMENWVMDLYVVEGHVQNGVVLIGDAFQTSCPAAGTGVSRLLTDVERLCHHVPQWLASPGMAADKIAAFMPIGPSSGRTRMPHVSPNIAAH
jgi:hypothetical protein